MATLPCGKKANIIMKKYEPEEKLKNALQYSQSATKSADLLLT